VFGNDNYKHLEDLGVTNLTLVDSNCAPFDLNTEQYRHKLEAIKCCFDQGYEEVQHLDWDCIPQKAMDEEYWTIMGQGNVLQANLQQYRRIKCGWRRKYSQDIRKVPNGGMFYLRGAEHIDGVIKCWESLRGPSCEPPMGLYVEELMGGKWTGVEDYWTQGFEAMTCDLHRNSCYSKEFREKHQKDLRHKSLFFRHYQG